VVVMPVPVVDETDSDEVADAEELPRLELEVESWFDVEELVSVPVLLVISMLLSVDIVVNIEAVGSLTLVVDEEDVLESLVTLLRVAEDSLPDVEKDVESLH
jgi:hypothetical protein